MLIGRRRDWAPPLPRLRGADIGVERVGYASSSFSFCRARSASGIGAADREPIGSSATREAPAAWRRWWAWGWCFARARGAGRVGSGGGGRGIGVALARGWGSRPARGRRALRDG